MTNPTTGASGSQSTPSIVVDQNNPLKLVSVWTRNEPNGTIIDEAAYSTDGGTHWFPLPTLLTGAQADPASTTGATYAQITDASVGFDRNDNFYVLSSQHSAGSVPGSGSLVLDKYNFSGAAPVGDPTIHGIVVYQWSLDGSYSDPAINPTLAVDDNLPTFTDVDGNGQTQTITDPYSGNVYVAWASNAPVAAQKPVWIVVSADGGQTFTTEKSVVGTSTDPNAAPRLAISQGRLPGTNGPSDLGVAPGQVTVVWDDLHAQANLFSLPTFPAPINSETDYINDGANANTAPEPAGFPIQTSFTSDLTIPADQLPNPNLVVSTVTVSLDLGRPILTNFPFVDQDITIRLIAPDGTSILLVNKRGGNGYNFLGTIFTDGPSQGPVSKGAAPFTGAYNPESPLAGLTGKTIAGTWQLQVVDNNPTDKLNFGFLADWSLNIVGTLGGAPPPSDFIESNQVLGSGSAQVFKGGGGGIPQGTPQLFPIQVNITDPTFTTLSDLAVTLSVIHPMDNQLSITLIAPNGTRVPLLLQGGVTGANLGISNGVNVGTTFDDQAPNGIGVGAAPYVGRFKPASSLTTPFGTVDPVTKVFTGFTAAQLDGTWKLEVVDNVVDTNVGNLVGWSLNFTSGLTVGLPKELASTLVLGSQTNSFRLDTSISGQGVGPAPAIASDNTLGAFSPYQGRLYVTFVNTASATSGDPNIYLVASDDGGLTWGALGVDNFGNPKPVLVNDDNSLTDGYTQGNSSSSRPQFQPNIAVDPATGTLVMSWYDTRDDASGLRPATYLTTSIDGGQTFSAQVFANTPQTAVDAITGKTVVLGPIPDNQVASNVGVADPLFGFGTHQGLAVYGGVVHLAWASNLNGGLTGTQKLNIETVTADIAAGPRIIASTMGPVGMTDANGNAIDNINPNRAADGTPIVSAFQVTFDRPVDPATFVPGDVRVYFRDTTTGNVSGGLVPVTSVVPLDDGPFGATMFQVNFAPRSAVGTYSYEIAPEITDRIRTVLPISLTGNTFTSNNAQNAVTGASTVNVSPAINAAGAGPASTHVVPPVTTITSTLSVSGFAASQAISTATVSLTITNPFLGTRPIPPQETQDFVLTLIAPDGTQVILSDQRGGATGEQFIGTTFDDSATIPIANGSTSTNPSFQGTFQPDSSLAALIGKSPNGTWKLQVVDVNPNSGDGAYAQIQNWSLQFSTTTSGPVVNVNPTSSPAALYALSSGNPMDQNANAVAGELAVNQVGPGDVFSAPTTTATGNLFNLTMLPDGNQAFFPGPYDPTTLPLIVSGPVIVSSTAVHADGSASTGNLVLNGGVDGVDVVFDRNMNPSTITPADVLRIMGPTGLISGPQTFTSTNVGQSIPDTALKPVVSTLTVPSFGNTFAISHLTVQLNISETSDSDLTITLIGPDGTTINLVTSGKVPGKTLTGANLTGTTFDDLALVSQYPAAAPYTGTFLPSQALAAFNGKQLQGTWQLKITDNVTNKSVGTLNSWSLLATPTLTITPNPQGSDPDPNFPQTYRIGFPEQQLSGTYVVTLASSVQSENGDALDTNQNAGVDLLNGGSATSPTTPITYNSPDAPLPVPVQPAVVSTLNVPDNFLIQGVTLTLNITYPHPGDLQAFLIAPDGTQVTLFENVGPSGSPANFTNTVFDDNASTSIENGTGPFFGHFTPQTPLGALDGKSAEGTWTLLIKNTGTSAGTLTGWSLTLLKALPTSGLGEPVADQASVSFRIFTMDPTNPLSSDTWTAVGPASISGPTVINAVSPQVPLAIPDATGSSSITPGKADSSIFIPQSQSILIQGLTLQLSITHPNVPDLTGTLIFTPLSDPTNPVTIPLFSNVGQPGQANFTTTVFDDNATTPISAGSAPFLGSFKPLDSLNQKVGGLMSAGTWTLEIEDDAPLNTGTITAWSLTFNDQLATNSQTPTNGNAGPVGAVAIDPSDPSGNTAYVAGASGGIWKTTNFLTTDPNGPTYIPLTDFGTTFGMNISSIAVFPRNNDPNQSIIFAATGDGYSQSSGYGGFTSQGVGFLRSMDGGATWTLLDSSDNTLPFSLPAGAPATTPVRDHIFAQTAATSTSGPAGGTYGYKVIVDPKLSASGNVIVYAAMGGTNGGLWRSIDTGMHWTKMSAALNLGDATDVLLDPNSGALDANGNRTGNLDVLYAAFPSSGVYMSPDQGQTLNLMTGTAGDPLIRQAQAVTPTPVAVKPPVPPTPLPGAGGRIVLAKPALLPASDPNAAVQNLLYEGWLYAASTTNTGAVQLYVTKDYGQTWTLVQVPTASNTSVNNITNLPNTNIPAIITNPTNNSGLNDYNVASNGFFPYGTYDLNLATDPNNPNIVYLGGTSNYQQSGLLRLDLTNIFDSHALVAFDNSKADSGALEVNTQGRVQELPGGTLGPLPTVVNDPTQQAYLNLLQNPNLPFDRNATILVTNTSAFVNDGSGVSWIPFDQLLQVNATATTDPSTNTHQILTMVDPLTGETRLIVADDQGVFTGVDQGNGTLSPGIGVLASPTYSRNGNLQITQFYYGAAQPSNVAAQIAQSLLYGASQATGAPASDPNLLSDGNLTWSGLVVNTGNGGGGTTAVHGEYDSSGVATDQQGNGTVYQFNWLNFGGRSTDFFSVNGIGRTTGLVQVSQGGGGPAPPDPQWVATSPTTLGGVPLGNFAVDPLNGDQIVISSNAGRIFATTTQGDAWFVIGNPANLDSTYAPAVAFGAPDPSAPAGVGNLNNLIYAGTVGGHIFLTQTGGGANGNQWTNISNGLDGSAVVKIVTNPTRGSHEAYAVTLKGVYHINDTVALANAIAALKPGQAINSALGWTNITGNLFSLTTAVFGNASITTPTLAYLSTIAADWRYVLPQDPTKAAGPFNPTHPVLYVAGEGGVFQSIDNGTTWAPFPSVALDGSPQDGGYLPDAHVTDLELSLGNIDPTTGRPVAQAGDPDLLIASTYGRGQFAIRLAPTVFPTTVALDPKLPAPSGSAAGGTAPDGTPLVTIAQPVIDGVSEQSAFGNTVYVTLYDMSDPSNPRIIGGYDPSNPSTAIAANETDSTGHFAVQVNKGVFVSNGLKTIGVQTTDPAGATGNMAILKFTIQTTDFGQLQPPTLALLSSDDTSGGQNITRVTMPDLIGQSNPSTPTNPVSIQLVEISGPQTVILPPVNTSPADGTFNFQLPALVDGTYTFQAVATNGGGSATGETVTFTIKTNGPLQAPTLNIYPADDSGVPGDGITDVRQPRFIGTTDPGAIVDLYSVLTSTINVPASSLSSPSATISSLNLNLVNISIATPNTLIVTLTGPDGTTVNVPGPYIGNVLVTGLNGKLAAGNYTLNIGNSGTSAGTFSGWLMAVSDSGNKQTPFPSTPLTGSSAVIQPKLASVTAGANGNFIVQLPNSLLNGSISLQVEAHDVAGNPAPLPSPVLNLVIVTTQGDYNLSGMTEPATLQRVNPYQLQWFVPGVTPAGGISFGAGGLDIPVQGDFDGDGKIDFAVYRPSTGTWYINRSTLGHETVQFGEPNVDIPVPADYDGVGVSDLAVFRPTTGQWIINSVSTGTSTITFGAPGDVPVPGNYDGTGHAELAVYDPATSTFSVLGPNGSYNVPLGTSGDIAVPGNYDNSVSYHNTELAVFDPRSATWIINGPNNQIETVQFGAPGDVPAPGDYDGTGITELAVYRPSTGQLLVDDAAGTILPGVANGIPAAAPLQYRMPASVASDFNGNGTANLAVFQRTNAFMAQWFIAGVSPPGGYTYGAGSLDIPLSGDFNGDGTADLALYRPSTAQWFSPALNGGNPITYGEPGVDIPVPGKYAGGTKTEIAVYRPTTSQWFINGGPGITFGMAGDVPVPGNYDGTGLTEIAVYRPSNGTFYVSGPNGAAYHTVSFGQPGDVPVPGSYDGAGRDQFAVYRPSTGQYIILSADGTTVEPPITVGSPKSIPAPGNYDGTGHDEPAVYNPATGLWTIIGPNGPRTVQNGTPNTSSVPITAPYSYRALPSATQSSSIHSASLDFASSAVSLSAPPPATVTPTNAVAPSSPTPAAATAPVAASRVRIAQAKAKAKAHSLPAHDAALLALQSLPGKHKKVRRGL